MAILFAAYMLSARLGMLLATTHGNISPVWPASGVVIAAFLIRGVWLWPSVFGAAVLHTLLTGTSIATSLGVGFASVLEPLIAFFLVTHIIGNYYPFGNPSDVFKYFILCGVVSSGVSAVFGVASLCFGGYAGWESFGYLWSTWCLGDMMGTIIVAPFLLTWARPLPFHKGNNAALEITIMALLVTAGNLLVFGTKVAFDTQRHFPITFMSVPFVLWPAFRFQQHGAVTTVLLTVIIAIVGTVGGTGPFSLTSTENTSLLMLQSFTGVMAITALVLAAAISERKQAEATLAAKARALVRSNADLQQFAYVASHDLQEPLRMIGSYCQLLERRYRGQLDQDADSFISYAVEGAKRMQDLIDDLLEYSRVGQKTDFFKPTDCNLALSVAVANLQASIKERQALITKNPLPVIPGDPTQLTQLFQNLIGNAIKYCEQLPPRIHVSTEERGDGWMFYVKDNGIGITPEHHQKIFLIFQRLHCREKYSGTGIGLAICKKIVEHHGGYIRVESDVGKGSIFSFFLPKQQAQVTGLDPHLAPILPDRGELAARAMVFKFPLERTR